VTVDHEIVSLVAVGDEREPCPAFLSPAVAT
jgi:hypothetical protein